MFGYAGNLGITSAFLNLCLLCPVLLLLTWIDSDVEEGSTQANMASVLSMCGGKK